MWMFVVLVALLHQNQAAPFAGTNSSSPQIIFQDQTDQTQTSPSPGVVQQQTASSSSSSASSSSADTSESSQSSEGPQQMRERQNVENTATNMDNTAVEHMESSQESVEVVQSPSTGNTSLWLSDLVLLGQRASERDTDTDTGDNSVESSRHRALMFHPLLTRPRSKEPALTVEANAAPTPGGVVMPTVGGTDGAVGVATGEKSEEEEFRHVLDDSAEKAGGPSFNMLEHPHHRGYHGNEDGLELGL